MQQVRLRKTIPHLQDEEYAPTGPLFDTSQAAEPFIKFPTTSAAVAVLKAKGLEPDAASGA
jgi:hypothetical protein